MAEMHTYGAPLNKVLLQGDENKQRNEEGRGGACNLQEKSVRRDTVRRRQKKKPFRKR